MRLFCFLAFFLKLGTSKEAYFSVSIFSWHTGNPKVTLLFWLSKEVGQALVVSSCCGVLTV